MPRMKDLVYLIWQPKKIQITERIDDGLQQKNLRNILTFINVNQKILHLSKYYLRNSKV